MASNYITALIHAAEQLMQTAGIAGPEARRALAPLIRQSVENSLEQGPAKALTKPGPVPRGGDVMDLSRSQTTREEAPVDKSQRSSGLNAARKGVPDVRSWTTGLDERSNDALTPLPLELPQCHFR